MSRRSQALFTLDVSEVLRPCQGDGRVQVSQNRGGHGDENQKEPDDNLVKMEPGLAIHVWRQGERVGSPGPLDPAWS